MKVSLQKQRLDSQRDVDTKHPHLFEDALNRMFIQVPSLETQANTGKVAKEWQDAIDAVPDMFFDVGLEAAKRQFDRDRADVPNPAKK